MHIYYNKLHINVNRMKQKRFRYMIDDNASFFVCKSVSLVAIIM
nr:MAG TPA: hypothetical protein [Caudoviricetes sp.]